MSGTALRISLAACLVWILSGCASADTREDEQWGDTGGKQDTEQFEKEMRAKHLLEKERLERIARLAAEKRSKVDRAGRSPGAERPAAGSTPPAAASAVACPDGLATYTCRCLGSNPPDWVSRADAEAWHDPNGFILAAARVDGSSGSSMAAGRAASRATAKILAFEQGAKASGQGFPDREVSGTLRGVETRAAFRAADGQVAVLVRYKPDGWQLDPALLQAKCPKLDKADYDCGCEQPVWIHLRAWVGDDGYVYATGLAPDTGKATEDRATGRARTNLLGMLQGMLILAAPLPDSGGKIRTTTSGDIYTNQTQLVASQPIEGGGLAVLIRCGTGK